MLVSELREILENLEQDKEINILVDGYDDLLSLSEENIEFSNEDNCFVIFVN